MKKIFLITTLVVLFFIPIGASADIIINEIAWMGIIGNQYGEWIELYNSGNEEIDLNNWKLYKYKDGNNILIFTLTKKLSSKSYLVIERTTDSSPDPLPNINDESGKFGGGSLLNLPGGEHLILKDSEDNIIEDLDFSNGWLEGNNSTKQTMERIDSGWQTSLNPGGTPKAPNSSGAVESSSAEATEDKQPETPSIPTGNNPPIANAGNDIIAFINQEIKFDGTKSSDPDNDELHYEWNMGNGKLIEKPNFTYKYLYPGTYLVTLMVYDGKNYVSDTISVKIQSQQITINEFLPNPSGKDEEEEWIEIYNDSDSIVDISSWQLDDADGGSKPFTFPQNTLIAPKNYLVFPRTITDLALNNTSDSVRLLLPEGVVFQEISYKDCKQGQSSARSDEGFVWSMPTPGMANIVNIPESIGGQNKEITYQYEPEKQTVKESSNQYVEYNPPEQDIEGGFVAPSFTETTEGKQESIEKDNLAAVVNKESFSENKVFDKNSFILILTLVGVIILALIVGLIITKFLKKSP